MKKSTFVLQDFYDFKDVYEIYNEFDDYYKIVNAYL